MESKIYLAASTSILTLLRTKHDLFKFKIARLANCTNPHTNSILKKFMKMGLTIEKKVGRRIYVTLSEKGKQVADNFLKII